jgi:neutral/alkaline ceramidase-like enzyme
MRTNATGWLACTLAATLAATTGAPLEAGQRAVTLRAGAAAVKITPDLSRTVFIAGYDNNRIAESVHDDLWARALVLDDGRTRMAVVVCDLIGLSNYRVRKIREKIRSVPPENVLLACTHVHSGPDTLGLWGKSFTSSGIDPTYMERLEKEVVAAVDAAAKELRPVRLSAGSVEVPDGLVYNSREPVQDRELTALRFTDAEGRTVATVIHYGAHPEINKSRALTSDFVHPVRERVEKRFGGVALFLNGALGGMVTPKITAHTMEEIRRVGEGVGKAAVQALEAAKPVSPAALSVRRENVLLPLENAQFKVMLGAKILDGEAKDGQVPTEVWRVDLGSITWITIPGEILPKPALALKAKIPGTHRMVVALGNDELGYILDPEDFDKSLYKYERSMSVGKQTWPLLLQAVEKLLGRCGSG